MSFMPDDVIGGFKIVKMIGHGGFGDIYAVRGSESGNLYAMKIEMIGASNRGIYNEIRILQKLQGSPYFPRIIATGETDNCRYLVLELLGPSLSKILRSKSQHKLSTVSALRVGKEMLKSIQQLHKKGILHRDIKPGNYLIRSDMVYPICLIDFGLAKSYLDDETGIHLDYKDNSGFVGTLKYASKYALNGSTQSRRDDLYSWFYSLMEMMFGNLPWANEKDRQKCYALKKANPVRKIKTRIPFGQIYRMIDKLGYDETPDYQGIIDIIDKTIKNNIETSDDKLAIAVDLLGENDFLKVNNFTTFRKQSVGSLYDSRSSIRRRDTDNSKEVEIGCSACNVA